jgi:hypothetical protein
MTNSFFFQLDALAFVPQRPNTYSSAKRVTRVCRNVGVGQLSQDPDV